MGADTYNTPAIKNLNKRMATESFEYNKKIYDVNYSSQQPSSHLHYCPETDVTDECSDIQIQLF